MSRLSRRSFVCVQFNRNLHQYATSWFPGHMGKGLKQMQQKLKTVDCIVEVHDARIPLSGRNHNFRRLLGIGTVKPHILVLNKMDLTDMSFKDKIASRLREEEISSVIYTNCKDQHYESARSVMNTAIDFIQKSDRFNRRENKELCLMIIGVPNVGKSSLINLLRTTHLQKSKAARVGAEPGVTRSVETRIKVCEDPPMFLLDTPGILEPVINNMHTGMKLALCGCFKDHLVGEEMMAYYLIRYLNLQGNYSYLEHLGLPAPVDDVREALLSGAKKNNIVSLVRDYEVGGRTWKPNLTQAAKNLITSFRKGYFGRVLLDKDLLDMRQ